MAQTKLTQAETLALVSILESGVGTLPLSAAIATSLPADKAMALITERKGVRLTRQEIASLVKAIYPLIPGTDLRGKLLWLVKNARGAFATEARYQEIIAYVKERLKALVNGEPHPDDPPATGALQELGAGTVPFYIKTLYWYQDLDDLKKDLAACGSARVGYGFEMMGPSSEKVMLSQAKIEQVEQAYALAIMEARRLGIWLYVIIVNDNMGEGKYGDPKIPLSKCLPGAKSLCAIVKKYGPANVICTPVAETKTSAGASFERHCASELSSFILAYNGGGGHPSSKPSWAKYIVQHPKKLSESYPRGTAVVNDTLAAILQAQGTQDGPLKPATIANWFADGAARDYVFIGAYAFKFRGHDAAGIKACSLSTSAPPTGNIPDTTGNILPAQVKWNGPDYSKAKVTRTITSASISGNHLNFKLAAQLGWPKSGSKNVDGMGFLIRKINGQYVGGKVEWCVSSRGWYDIKTNVKDGYNGSTMPASGETVWCGIGHPENTSECTTLVPVVWK